MSTYVKTQDVELPQHFKQFNKFVLMLWRLGLGKWVNGVPSLGGRILVITHTGRKSGKIYRTPVNYAEIDGDVYCLAGMGSQADWYLNVKANPAVEIWLPNGWWAGAAEELTEKRVRLPLMRQVLINSGKAAPAYGIFPETMTDEELEQAVGDARLFRIRKTEARTGDDGPGDLAWVWPLTTLLLLLVALFHHRNR